MPSVDRLLAWIGHEDDGRFVAAFVVSNAYASLPATRAFDRVEDARRWVEAEADRLGLTVTWVEQRPLL